MIPEIVRARGGMVIRVERVVRVVESGDFGDLHLDALEAWCQGLLRYLPKQGS